MPKETITIAGVEYTLRGKKYESDDGHRLPSTYQDGPGHLKQQLRYGNDEVEFEISKDHPSQG